VIIPAGVPRKPGMTRDDLFKVRAAAEEAAHAFVTNDVVDVAAYVLESIALLLL
jgi:malate/lactate dehydrogenase